MLRANKLRSLSSRHITGKEDFLIIDVKKGIQTREIYPPNRAKCNVYITVIYVCSESGSTKRQIFLKAC